MFRIRIYNILKVTFKKADFICLKNFTYAIIDLLMHFTKESIVSLFQLVKIENAVSRLLEIEVGVPQGTVLEPFLFSANFDSSCCNYNLTI